MLDNEVPVEDEYITAWCEMVHDCTDSAKSPFDSRFPSTTKVSRIRKVQADIYGF